MKVSLDATLIILMTLILSDSTASAAALIHEIVALITVHKHYIVTKYAFSRAFYQISVVFFPYIFYLL